MTTPPSVDDPGHWRQRAEDARREADRYTDPLVKQALLDIARAYEELASMIETKPVSEADDKP
jgi:hypothetical protein